MKKKRRNSTIAWYLRRDAWLHSEMSHNHVKYVTIAKSDNPKSI